MSSRETRANPPIGYDLNKADEIPMQRKLKEISGIHYIKENLIVAIQDEKGIIYTVDVTSGKIVAELKFGGSGDYEDVCMDEDFYYVLESNGTIFKVPMNGDMGSTKKFKLPGNSRREFETIYVDPAGQYLVVICKSCPGNKRSFDGFSFKIDSEEFNAVPVLNIDANTAETDGVSKGSDYKPSAAAIHPIENKLYVLSSVGKLLLVCALQGKVEKVFSLDPGLYKQPEGIAFAPNGDMFISNEGTDGKGNILKLAYEK